jgi:hypothetical protein
MRECIFCSLSIDELREGQCLCGTVLECCNSKSYSDSFRDPLKPQEFREPLDGYITPLDPYFCKQYLRKASCSELSPADMGKRWALEGPTMMLSEVRVEE